jgi:tetratricopeptide (TPR) repeat protein
MTCPDRRFSSGRRAARGLLLGLAVLLAAPLGCGDDASRLAEHMTRGEASLEAEKPNEAAIEFKNALQIDPNHAPAHFGLAKAYLAQRDVRKAYWELSETVRLDPENIDARLALGQFLLLGGEDEFNQAVEQAAAILERQPERWEAFVIRASALESLKRLDEARADYEKAVELAPDNADVLRTLAAFLTRAGDLATAEPMFRQLVEKDPSTQSWFQLGAFLAVDRERDAEAEQAFRSGLGVAKEEEKSEAHQRLASFYYQRERYDEAEKVLQDGIESTEDDLDLIYALARFYHSRGAQDRADAMIEEAARSKPDEVAPYLILSAYRGRNGDLPGALEAAEKALAVDAENKPARLRKAELLIDMGLREGDQAKLAQGRAIVDAVLAQDASSAEAHFVRGKIELAEGRPADAATAVRRALELKPDWAQAHFLLASALLVQGDRQQARAEALRALERDAEFVEARMLLARIHALLGESDQAIEEARRILRQRPDSRDMRILLAQSLVHTGRAEDARVELEAIPLDARDAEVLFALGRIDMLHDKPELARAKLLQALEKAPGHPEILESLLQVDVAEGRGAESLTRIRAALAAATESPALVRLEALALLATGEGPQAEARLRRAIELDPNDLASYQALARYLLGSGRRAESIQTYEQAVQSRPEFAPLRFTLGTLYEAEGRRQDAIAQYEEAIRIDDGLAVAKNNLAYLLAEEGRDLDRALDLAQAAKAQLPESPNAADTLGWVLLKKGITGAAVDYLRESERGFPPNHPDLGWVRLHLAQAYEANGQPEEARAVLERALEGFAGLEREARARGFEGAITPPPWVADVKAMLGRLPGAPPAG